MADDIKQSLKTEVVEDWCNGVPAYGIRLIGSARNTARILFAQGYRITSRKFRIASRVDKPYDNKGGRLDDDYARRCYSKDNIRVPEGVRKHLTDYGNA